MIDKNSFDLGVQDCQRGITFDELSNLYPSSSSRDLSAIFGWLTASIARASGKPIDEIVTIPDPGADDVDVSQALTGLRDLYIQSRAILEGMAHPSFSFGVVAAEDGHQVDVLQQLIAGDDTLVLTSSMVELGWTTRIEHAMAVTALRDFGQTCEEFHILRTMVPENV
jgi:hypothetical protein